MSSTEDQERLLEFEDETEENIYTDNLEGVFEKEDGVIYDVKSFINKLKDPKSCTCKKKNATNY